MPLSASPAPSLGQGVHTADCFWGRVNCPLLCPMGTAAEGTLSPRLEEKMKF